MSVLTISNQKGGSGKTSLCIALSSALLKEGYRIALFDTDSDDHLSTWHQKAVEGERVGGQAVLVRMTDWKALPPAIQRTEPNVDLIIIDTRGSDAAINQSAILAADLVLTPVKPGAFEARMATEIAATVNACSISANRKIPHHVVLNGSARTKAARHTKTELEQIGMSVLPIELPDTTQVYEATWTGDYPNGGTYGVRLRSLVTWIKGTGLVAKKTKFAA